MADGEIDVTEYERTFVEHLRTNYANGYYTYCLTLTFKDGTVYADSHPRVGYQEFKKVFSKYMGKRNCAFWMYPEIGKSGRFHYHGLVSFKREAKDFDKFESELRLIKNYMRRKFGLFTLQRVYSMWDEYEVSDMGYYIKCKTLKTDLKRIVHYIVKDINKYGFLQPYILAGIGATAPTIEQ